jgi:Flp pilus assembly protein TadD
MRSARRLLGKTADNIGKAGGTVIRNRTNRLWGAVLIFAAGLYVVPAQAQSHAAQREQTGVVQTRRAVDESRRPSQIERDFAPPDPSRPWGPPRHLHRYRSRYYPYGHRGYRYHRWYYDDDYTYRFGPRRSYGYEDADLEQAYRQGVADGRHAERFEVQAERGLANYEDAMARGHAAFRSGDYATALRDFLLAATLNQGDPTSRICAAHARVAAGDYEPAARLLRRAFELQPKIMYLPLDVRTAYGDLGDFQKHRRALRHAAGAEPEHGDLWFVLGYMYFFSDDLTKAARTLAHAAELLPDDALVARLADLARAGAARTHDPDPPGKRRSGTPREL